MKTRKIAKLIIMIYLLIPQIVNAQQRENDQDYWIDKFFSVSFPLKSIKINSAFGIRSDPFTGKHKRHNGLDLKARYEEVLSMFDGLVEATGSDRGSGKYIVMRYGVYMVSYCHLSQIWVRQGQAVLAGDAIGVSGNTGRSTGPHLHLTSRYHGQLDDPINLLLHIRETRKKALKALNLDGDNLSTPEDFIRRYADIAMRQQKKYGIPASVILAQMAYESGWGSSDLAQKGNNYFGIKCSSSWLRQGLPYSLHNDDRPNEKFCNFSCVEEGVEYHTRLLMSDRYARCWRYGPTDYHNWLKTIKASGYATRKDYVTRCEKIIKKHKLYIYDQKALKI